MYGSAADNVITYTDSNGEEYERCFDINEWSSGMFNEIVDRFNEISLRIQNAEDDVDIDLEELERIYMALDYFDASINRISAWTLGFRNWQKALLNALCTPNELLTKLQDNNELTELQVMQDEMKTMPFGDVWNEYCRQCGVKGDREWFDYVKQYEKEFLSER